MRAAWLVALTLAACGGKREAEDYLLEYTEAYCAFALECGDPAQMVFDGTDSAEACVATRGPAFAAQWEGCVLDQKDADRCLTFLAGTDCPSDGDVDSVIPAECATAWKKCIGGAPTEGTPTAASTAEE